VHIAMPPLVLMPLRARCELQELSDLAALRASFRGEGLGSQCAALRAAPISTRRPSVPPTPPQQPLTSCFRGCE
jgi:hypothetical protein